MLAELRRHALPGVAEIVEGAGRLPAVKVTAGQATGMVYLHGAHVAAWKPAGFEEVLWMSAKSTFEEGRPIRGGVPICFPWFGPKPDAPAHGFVRLKAWELESIRQEAAGVTVTLAYAGSAADEAVRKYWPHDFVLRQRVTFGTELTMALELTNRGGAPLRAEEALHTYFSLGDVRQARTAGLSGARYIDKTDGMKEKLQEGDIAITAETDRVYLETRSAVTVTDLVKRRRITVSKEHSAATVVWNPWVAKSRAMPDFGDEEWPGMLCVETCNVGASAVEVAPGGSHIMTARIAVAGL